MLSRLRNAIKGWKTHTAALSLVAIGLIQLSGTIDFHALLAPFIKDETMLGSVAVASGVVFGVLRFVTTGPCGFHREHDDDVAH